MNLFSQCYVIVIIMKHPVLDFVILKSKNKAVILNSIFITSINVVDDCTLSIRQ